MIEITALIVGTFATSLIALTVLSKNSRSTTNRLFVALAVGLVGWSITTYLSLHTSSDAQTLFWIRWIMFFVVAQNTAFFYLARVFPSGKLSEISHRTRLVAAIFSIMTASVALSPLLFPEFKDGVPVAGPGMIFFLPHALIFAVGSLILLIIRFFKARGFERSQLQYFIAGILLMFTVVPIGNFVLPVAFKLKHFVTFSPLYAIIFSGLIAYAIVAKKMFDVRLIVARSVAYVLSLGLLAAIYASLTSWLANRVFSGLSNDTALLAINTSGFLVAVLAYPYIKRFFDKVTNKLFYRDAYDAQAFLDQLNKVLVGNVELENLLQQSSKVIADNLKAEFCLFWVGQTSYLPRRTISASRHRLDEESVGKIRSLIPHNHRNVIVTDELQSGSELHAHLNRNGVAVLTQIVTKSKNDSAGIGYMVLGQKKSGNVYNSQDIKLISIIANELIIATQNALRFEEIEHFNLTLQEKVDDATKQLRHTNERLKLLDETKDDFISMASHQLRTPLTSVKGYLSMVLEGDAGKLNEKEKKLLNQAFISSQRMVYLISDLLNVSRLRTGKFVIEPSPVNLAEVTQGEVEQLIETAGSRNLTLSYEKPKQFPVLMLDETKIRQVVMNFMDNAVHYTPSGGHINVILEDKGSSIELRVEDDGLGVPRHEQHHLFTKFFRAGNAKKARPDGTGLGLFMAKKVIIAQGGSIIFKSQEGKGSTFGFTFAKAPLQPPVPTQARPK